MAEAFASISGHRIIALRVVVGNVGPWYAECDLEGDADLSGAVTISLPGLDLHGTVTRAAGSFGSQRKLRVTAGAAGWAKVLPAKGYANDAGIRASLIVQDAARDAGEALGGITPASERIGVAYARQSGPASRVLEDVIGATAWWVDYAGKTQVGPRPTRSADARLYDVLAYDPRARLATLSVDALSAVQIGSVLTERLDAPQTVRELEIRLNAEELRVLAWCGGAETSPSQLAGLLRAVVARASDSTLPGLYRYRVGGMSGQRVNLQAVSSGVPDLLPASLWPGIPGAHATLTPGAEVLVQFIDGSRTLPVITHFAGADGVGFVPVLLALGGASGPFAARQGDAVQVTLPPAAFAGTIGGSPATGTVTWAPPATASGTIIGGSTKVQVA